MWTKIVSLIGWVLAGLTISVPLMAGEIQTRSFPVPSRVDHSYWVPTSLYIKCDFKQYDLSFPEFLSRESGKRETAFKQLILALRNKNLPACLALTSQNISQAENTRAANITSGYFRDAVVGKNFEKMRVVNQFYFGKVGLFIWGVDSKTPVSSGPFFRSWFRFETTSDNRFLWNWNTGRVETLAALLRKIMEHIHTSPTSFVPIEDRKFDYEIPIPGTTVGHTAYLQFNGKVYDFNVFTDKANPGDEILTFYQRAYHAFKYKPETFADFYTKKSRDKYLKWVSNMGPERFKMYHKDALTGERRVLFILDADPMYIVFYRRKIGDVYNIHHKYIIREPKDGKLRLTNFYIGDSLDNFINDRELFEPILKSIIKTPKKREE